MSTEMKEYKITRSVKMLPEVDEKISLLCLKTDRKFSTIANKIMADWLGVVEPVPTINKPKKMPRQRVLSLSPKVVDALVKAAGVRKISATELINNILKEMTECVK